MNYYYLPGWLNHDYLFSIYLIDDMGIQNWLKMITFLLNFLRLSISMWSRHMVKLVKLEFREAMMEMGLTQPWKQSPEGNISELFSLSSGSSYPSINQFYWEWNQHWPSSTKKWERRHLALWLNINCEQKTTKIKSKSWQNKLKQCA